MKAGRAEHVGSLLRPPALKQAVHDFHSEGRRALLPKERTRHRERLRELEDHAIRDVVRKQVDIGLNVVTDGEFRRYMFLNSFWDGVEGFSADRNPVEFRDDEGNTVTWHVQQIEDRLRHVASPACDEAKFMALITEAPYKITFPAASLFALPFTFKPGVNDHAYESLEALVAHVVEIERAMIRRAVEAGLRYVQFDFPAYPYLVDSDWRQAIEATGWTVERVFELAIQADLKVKSDLPADVTTAMHICRGNNQSRYLCQGSLEPIAEALFSRLDYDVFLIEWEDRARMGGFEPLRFLPKTPVVVLGVVSSKRAALEREDDVLRLVDEASRFVPLDQLALSTQCGFASTVIGNSITEAEQWRKLTMIVRCAERLWG